MILPSLILISNSALLHVEMTRQLRYWQSELHDSCRIAALSFLHGQLYHRYGMLLLDVCSINLKAMKLLYILFVLTIKRIFR